MPIEPRQQNTIYTSIRDRILASNSEITNWSETSVERAIVDDGVAFALDILWHGVLAAQLSGWIEYAGGPITRQDLAELDLAEEDDGGTVDLDLLNLLMDDSDLDAKARQNGVVRDPGSFATGTIEADVRNDGVEVDSGFRVQTADTSLRTFETTEPIDPPEGTTTVTVPIEATERGTEFNVGAGTIERIPEPRVGVTSVTNPTRTTGGDSPESNESLRTRARRALIQQSDGGTRAGVRGGLISAFDGLELRDVIVDETVVPVEIVVDGGPDDATLEDEIDSLRPIGVNVALVRPTQISVAVDATVTTDGGAVEPTLVEDAIAGDIENTPIGNDLIRDSIIATIMDSVANIRGISDLTITSNGTVVSDDVAVTQKERIVLEQVSVSVAP